MNKNGTGIGLLLSKSMCVALAMVLAACLFAAGAFAEPVCGDGCRCHHGPMDTGHSSSKGHSIPSSADLCNGDPMIPCGFESSPASRFTDFIPVSVGVNQLPTVGPANLAVDCDTDGLHFSGEAAFQPWLEKSRSAPLYLQNASFLI